MSSVSNIVDGFKIAFDLANTANRVEDVKKLIETQQLVMQVLEDNRQLTAQVAELKDELAMDSQLVREGFAYYIEDESGGRPARSARAATNSIASCPSLSTTRTAQELSMPAVQGHYFIGTR